MIYFGGYRGTSPISCLIRARTGLFPPFIWARYSHFSVIDWDHNQEIEAWSPDGVLCGAIGGRHTPGTEIDLYRFKKPLSAIEESQIWANLYSQIGKPYDLTGVLGFLWLARWLGFHASRRAWFCSELCKWAARQVGRLMKGLPPYRESPEDLSHESELIFFKTIVISGETVSKQKKGENMKNLVLSCIMALCMLTWSGCASIYTVSQHDKAVMAQNAVKLQATAGGAVVSFDVLSLGTGYFQAWADQPGTMTAATFLDALTGAGLYLAGKELAGGSDSTPTDPVQAPLTINGNGNTVVIGSGAGHSSNSEMPPVSGE